MMIEDRSHLHVVIVSASFSDTSRSRIAAEYARHRLLANGVGVNLIDLRSAPLLAYPHAENDPRLSALVQQFNAADAWVLATPVYNWGASGVLTNFLHYVLDDDRQRRFRPFVAIGGASTAKSHLALDGLCRTLIYEIWAVQVGPAILAVGDLADTDDGTLAPELQERIDRSVGALVHCAVASTELRAVVAVA